MSLKSPDQYGRIEAYLDNLAKMSEHLCESFLSSLGPSSSFTPSYADGWRLLFPSIISAMTDFVSLALIQKNNNSKKNSAIFFQELSRKIGSFMSKNGCSLDDLVRVVRALEKTMIERDATSALSRQDLIMLGRFFEGLHCGLSCQWLQWEKHRFHTKLREANRYILLEKRRYYAIFNRMVEPAFIIDQKMRVVDTNRAFNHFFDIKDKAEHIGKVCFDVMGKEVCAACAMEEMLGEQKSFSGIDVVIPVKSELKTVLFSGTFLGDINSEFAGGIIIIQDITQKKEIEKALLESEEHYRTLVENVPDVTWRADQDGTLVFVSPNVEKICGFSAAEMTDPAINIMFSRIHYQDVDLVRSEFHLFFYSHLPFAARAGNRLLSPQFQDESDVNGDDGPRIFDVRYRFQKKDGTWIWLHDRASKIYQKDGAWFTDGVFSDITELKQAEEELEKHHFRMAELVDERTSELRQANEQLKHEMEIRKKSDDELLDLALRLKISNEELEQFAYVASHDLKEPLMLVQAFSERLQRKYSDKLDATGQEYIKRLLKATNQMRQLIDGLLALSRISTSESDFEQVDMTTLIHEVIQNLEEKIRQVRGQIKLSELGSVDGDPVQLRQLFQNIIVNALKYYQKSITPNIHIKGSLVGDKYYEISVEDNGIGFDQSLAEHIFKPFARLHRKEQYEGSGMGLATCQKIVFRHGGEITAQSRLGAGSTFIIRLPVRVG